MKSKNTQLQKSETSKLEATISMVGGNPNKTAPTLGYFSSGFDPLAARMKYMGSGSSSNTIKFYRNTKYPKRFEAVIKPKGEGVGVDFVGTNYRGPGKNNFALGVLDKITGTLTVTDINTDKVLRLEPVVRASHNEPETPTPTPTPANNQNASAVQDDTRDRKNSLINLYGTKTAVTKAKRAMQLRRDEDYDGSKVEVMQAIENMSKSIDKEAIVSWSCNAVGTHSDIPPYDLSATLPEKAYLLDKIILKGEWAYVRDLLQIKPPLVYPSFVCNRFYKLELTKDEAEKERLACIMSYIYYVIDFKNQYSLGGSSSSSSKHHHHHHHERFIPNMLLMKFSKMFLDAEKNRLADEKIGSLISYVLVLTLFVDEFQTDFTDIAKDLKIGILKARSHLLNLGCKFNRRNVAHLPVPLTFPPPNKKRRRRRQ